VFEPIETMSREEIETFKARIKAEARKSGIYTTEEVKFIMLILDALIKARHKYAVSASAQRYNFDFALKAASHYQEFTAAITFFERLIQKKGPV
jgi:hypothetical protein